MNKKSENRDLVEKVVKGMLLAYKLAMFLIEILDKVVNYGPRTRKLRLSVQEKRQAGFCAQ